MVSTQYTLQDLQAGDPGYANLTLHAGCSPLDWQIFKGVKEAMGCIASNMQWYVPFPSFQLCSLLLKATAYLFTFSDAHSAL